jgi:hypothetical protein
VTFRISNGIIEGKLQWLSGLLKKFLGKSRLNPENTEELAAIMDSQDKNENVH